MSLYKAVPVRNALTDLDDLSVLPGEESRFCLEPIVDYAGEIERIRSKARFFQEMESEVLLDFFDLAARELISTSSGIVKNLHPLGIPFLLTFLKRVNLERLLGTALHGCIECLDNFTEIPILGKKVMALPRGVVTHWLAGNVLNLGIISLVQGILTKNANVLKIPSRNGTMLPAFMSLLADIEVNNGKGRSLSGRDLLNTILFVQCDRTDLVSQRILSANSDVRIIWGGREAVAQIQGLPKKKGTEDIVFGPRNSLALIGRSELNDREKEELAYRLALDASVFEQRACTSPHTVFIETGGKISPLDWAKAIAAGMRKALQRTPKLPVTADEAYTVVNARSRFLMSGEIFASEGTEWTVIYTEQHGVIEPCGSRVLFVRPVKNIMDILDYLDDSVQALGLYLNAERRAGFEKLAAERGVQRITEIGYMHVFDYPWEGMFPMDRLVRWVFSG